MNVQHSSFMSDLSYLDHKTEHSSEKVHKKIIIIHYAWLCACISWRKLETGGGGNIVLIVLLCMCDSEASILEISEHTLFHKTSHILKVHKLLVL